MDFFQQKIRLSQKAQMMNYAPPHQRDPTDISRWLVQRAIESSSGTDRWPNSLLTAQKDEALSFVGQNLHSLLVEYGMHWNNLFRFHRFFDRQKPPSLRDNSTNSIVISVREKSRRGLSSSWSSWPNYFSFSPYLNAQKERFENRSAKEKIMHS